MIIAKAGNEKGGELLIFGLSTENVKRIQAGKPLLISQRTGAPDGCLPDNLEIMIFFGETEQDMYDQFKALNLITPETEVHKSPKK